MLEDFISEYFRFSPATLSFDCPRSILPFNNLIDVFVLWNVELGSYDDFSSGSGRVSFKSPWTEYTCLYVSMAHPMPSSSSISGEPDATILKKLLSLWKMYMSKQSVITFGLYMSFFQRIFSDHKIWLFLRQLVFITFSMLRTEAVLFLFLLLIYLVNCCKSIFISFCLTEYYFDYEWWLTFYFDTVL